MRIDEHGLAGARALAEGEGIASERIDAAASELRGHGLIAEGDGHDLSTRGRNLAARAMAARRELLLEALADESAGRDPAVDELLRRLSRQLAGEPPALTAGR